MPSAVSPEVCPEGPCDQNVTSHRNTRTKQLHSSQSYKTTGVFSISRLTQMARTRTIEQGSPRSQSPTTKIENDPSSQSDQQPTTDSSQMNNSDNPKNNNNELEKRWKSRLKSQSSILSFPSSSHQAVVQTRRSIRPIDAESDNFLRRFATNNSNIEKSIKDHEDEPTRYHKLCLDV